jgi:hypothetical protein
VVPGYYYNSGTSGSPIWKRLATVEVDNTFKLVSTGTAQAVNSNQTLSAVDVYYTINNSTLQVIVPSGFGTNRVILQWNTWGSVDGTTATGSLRFQVSQTSPTTSTIESVMMSGWAISSGSRARWSAPVSYILTNVSAGTYTFSLQVRRESEAGTVTGSTLWGVAATAQVFVQ